MCNLFVAATCTQLKIRISSEPLMYLIQYSVTQGFYKIANLQKFISWGKLLAFYSCVSQDDGSTDVPERNSLTRLELHENGMVV